MKADGVQPMCSSSAGHSLDPVLPPDPCRCLVLSRRTAGIEMLMKPTIGRHKQSPLFPVDTNRFRRARILRDLGPHQAVADPAQHEYMRAGSVPMGAFVRSCL